MPARLVRTLAANEAAADRREERRDHSDLDRRLGNLFRKLDPSNKALQAPATTAPILTEWEVRFGGAAGLLVESAIVEHFFDELAVNVREIQAELQLQREIGREAVARIPRINLADLEKTLKGLEDAGP